MVKYLLTWECEFYQASIVKRKDRPIRVNLMLMIPHFSEIFKSRFYQGRRESEPVLNSLRLTTIAISSENIKKGEGGEHKLRQ